MKHCAKIPFAAFLPWSAFVLSRCGCNFACWIMLTLDPTGAIISASKAFFSGCCIWQSGKIGKVNSPYMSLKACLCPGIVVSITSAFIWKEHRLGLDTDNICLIRCNNCLQIFFASSLAVPCSLNVKETIYVLVLWTVLLDVAFTVGSDCSTSQTYHEIKFVKTWVPPSMRQWSNFQWILAPLLMLPKISN